MAPKPDSAEAIVLNYVNEQNRPLNTQNVADALQKFNLKKATIQKTLDSLSDSAKITFKEYGKQKIYLARQDHFHIPSSDELSAMNDSNSALQQHLAHQKKALADLETETKALQSNLTLNQIRDTKSRLCQEVHALEERVLKMRTGARLVDPDERKAVEFVWGLKAAEWRKRKRMFKDVWDAITDNSPKDLNDFKNELGLEFDEDVSVSLPDLLLLHNNKKRTK